MQKLSEVKNRYNEKLKEYQMYYVDSVVGSDRKIKNQMKKKADEVSIPLKYYEAEVRTIESLINWLEQLVKQLQESLHLMNNEMNDKEKIKTTYGSLRFYEDCYNKEIGQLTALQNLLSYLKS
jgi:transketolase